jgi:lambda family phage portal protein
MGVWSSIRRAMFGSDASRAWDAAKTTRLNEAQWAQATGDHINDKIGLDLVTLRNRAIDEAERNPFVEGMIETYVASVVGVEGPSLQVQSEDEEWNEWAERVWWDWWQQPDLNGVLSGVDLMRQWVRSLWVCGEFVTIEVSDESRDIAYCLQDVHPRRLKTPFFGISSALLRDGVERNELGKPIRYYIESFLSAENAIASNGAVTPYDADSVIHGFKQREPGQIRGIPWLAPVLQTCADLRCYDEQVMDAARAAADMAVLLQTNHPDATYVQVNESTAIQRRTIRTLPPGWTASQMNPAQPAAQYTDYRSERLRELGRPVNMPLMMVRLDSSNHNYSSARFDGQLYSRGVASTQRWLVRCAMDRMTKKLFREAGLRDGQTPPERYETRWTWEAMPHVDPGKEASAAEKGLATNSTTLADICATGGKDWEQVLKQRAREEQMKKDLGLLPPVPEPAEPPALTPTQQRWIVEQIEARIEEGASL